MSKYTVDDFRGAMFAEHPDGRLAHRINHADGWSWAVEDLNGKRDRVTENYMIRLGWVPVPAKPTITESTVRWMENQVHDGQFLSDILAAHGIEIIPGPEPTNAEKLEQLYSNWSQSNLNPPFGEWADSVGVKAPEGWGNE